MIVYKNVFPARHFGQVLNILHIAEHMADDKANEFLQQAKKFD